MPVFTRKNSLSVGLQNVSFSDTDIVNYLNPSAGDSYISANDALKNSDIFSAIFQLSGDLATAKWTASDSRFQGMLDKPSATSNGHAFWQSVLSQFLLGGEAFVYRWRNQNGVDVRWDYLRPSQVSSFELADGSGLIYNITFDEPSLGVKQAVPASDIFHFRLVSKNGGKTGTSPLLALSDELEIKKESNKLTLNALRQSVVTPGLLSIKHGGLLDSKQKAARSREFMNQMNKSNNGVIVLDDLEDYTPLEIKTNVANLLSQTDWTRAQIAKVYAIPENYLNGSGDQQSSVDQIKGMYATALHRYMMPFVSELMNKGNVTIETNIRPALDPLSDGYAKNVSALLQSGTITQEQSVWLLQQAGYLPNNIPKTKGGEVNEELTN